MSICNNKEIMNEEAKLASYDDRDIILDKLSDAIDYIHKKAMKGRIINEKNEKVRISWFKSLAYACSIYNQIKRDVELDQLKYEMEILKSQISSLDNNSSEQFKGRRDFDER